MKFSFKKGWFQLNRKLRHERVENSREIQASAEGETAESDEQTPEAVTPIDNADKVCLTSWFDFKQILFVLGFSPLVKNEDL